MKVIRLLKLIRTFFIFFFMALGGWGFWSDFNVAQGKSFYLTVRRDFSPAEKAQIELIYNRGIPLRVRLLRPRDMESFIKEQIDLHRAWQEPQAQFNSARPFLKGLNKTKLDVDWLRYNFSEAIRKPMNGILGGGKFAEKGTSFFEGPAKLIRAPEHFELITEFSVDIGSENANQPFDVPGFNWYFGSSSDYKNQVIELPEQASGFYVLQVVQGDDEGQVVLVVNDIKAMLQQSSTQALFRVTDRSGQALKGAQIKLRNTKGEWVGEGKTDADGVAEIATRHEGEFLAVIQGSKGQGTAIIDSEFLSTDSTFPDVFIYSDRPMYQPGEGVVKYKGIVRQRQQAWSQLFKVDGPVRTSLSSAEGLAIGSSSTDELSEFGSFSGELPLQEIFTSGIYQLTAKVNGVEHSGEIRVKEYSKPLFFLKVSSSVDSVIPGQSLPLKMEAERYAGGSPLGVVARIEILRVRYDGPEWVADAGFGEKGSEETYGFSGDQKVPIIPISVDEITDLEFSSQGQREVKIPIPHQLPGDPAFDYKILVRITARDRDGNFASIDKTFLEATKDFVLQTRASGIYAEKDHSAWVEARALTPGGTPFGSISGVVEFSYFPYQGPSQVLDNKTFQSDELGRVKIDFPTVKTGVIKAQLTFQSSSGFKNVTSSEILIADPSSTAPLKKVNDLTLLSRRQVYRVGELAKILALLPENWGVNGSNSGRVYITIAGRRIFSQSAHQLQGNTFWVNLPITEDLGSSVSAIVAYSDSRLGFIEKRMTFDILPEEKILKVSVKPSESLLDPGSEQKIVMQVLDNANQPVESEISLSVVDRAVLDLQPEFRPQLLEFFYPRDRLNLMTFFSNQFQSYGYSDTIARLFQPNYAFTATKPAEEPKVDQDTAYWNPRILTDSRGQAEVHFTMPPNQTIWKVTAVAIDKRGRFGEGKGEFKTQTEVPITLAMPKFIRKGEAFHLRLAGQNLNTHKTHHLSLKLMTSSSLGFQGKDPLVEADLAPGEEFIRRIELNPPLAESATSGSVDIIAKVDGIDRNFRQDIKLLDGFIRTPFQQPFSSEQQLQLRSDSDERITEPRVRIFEGFSGTVIPALRWLSQYPYGCIEQLTNSTLPNLAIAEIWHLGELNSEKVERGFWFQFWQRAHSIWLKMWSFATDLFKKGQAIELSEEQKKMLAQAAQYGRLGIQRIDALQIKDGRQKGVFQWFQGANGTLPMQYYVLLSLLNVESPELLEGLDLVSAYKALETFSYSSQMDDSVNQFLKRYVRSRLTRLKIIDEKLGVADLQFSLEFGLSSRSIFYAALALQMVQDATLEEIQSVNLLRGQVQDYLASELDKVVNKSESTKGMALASWPDYLGRGGSTVSLVAKVLHNDHRLNEDLLGKVREFLIAQFNGENFGSTFETGQILMNSIWLLKWEQEKRRLGRPPVVNVDGNPIDSQQQKAILAGWELNLDPTLVEQGVHDMSVQLNYPKDKAYLVGFRSVPLSKSTKPVEGMGSYLRRKIYRLNESSQQLTELGEGSILNIGDLIYIENRIRPNWNINSGSSAYYLLENDIPSGTTLVQDDSRFDRLAVYSETSGWVKREESQGRLNYYFDFSSNRGINLENQEKVGFVLRVNYAGRFYTGVSRFMDFYDESHFSQSGSFAFRVEPDPHR